MEEVLKPEAQTEIVTDVEAPARRRKIHDGENDQAVIRVKLPVDIGMKVRETISELKTRGVNISAEDLLAEYLDVLPTDYLENQLIRLTPEEYFLEFAVQIPEVRNRLLRQAKKALSRKNNETPSKQKRTRQRTDEIKVEKVVSEIQG